MNTSSTSGLAVVVGGASGIGAAVAEQHRRREIPVLTWDVADAADIACDVADPDAIDAALAETMAVAGVPSLLTITAGIGHGGMLLDITPDEWDAVMSVNTRGALLAMRATARAMRDSGADGSIVAVSSISGRLVDRMMGAYCVSKAALDMLVRVAAAEWGEYGIRVNAVAPGVTQTPMLAGAPTDDGWLPAVRRRTPLGRLGTADDIAETVVAVHDLGWVTGQVLECDGGLGIYSPIDVYGESIRVAGDGA